MVRGRGGRADGDHLPRSTRSAHAKGGHAPLRVTVQRLYASGGGPGAAGRVAGGLSAVEHTLRAPGERRRTPSGYGAAVVRERRWAGGRRGDEWPVASPPSSTRSAHLGSGHAHLRVTAQRLWRLSRDRELCATVLLRCGAHAPRRSERRDLAPQRTGRSCAETGGETLAPKREVVPSRQKRERGNPAPKREGRSCSDPAPGTAVSSAAANRADHVRWTACARPSAEHRAGR